jgi:hypothetical protein
MLRIQRGLRPRLGAKQIISCDGEHGWECALAGLAGALEKPEWQNAEVTVILSNHFVRYQLVAWSDQLSSDDERAALMRHCYSEVYGSAVADWELRWSEDQPGAPWLACAVEKSLLDRLRETLKQAGLHLHSVQPYLMAAFNRWRKEFAGARQWFVLGEPGRICVSQIQDGAWCSIRSHRIEGTWKDEASLILEREMLLAEGDGVPQEILLQAPEGLVSAGGASRRIRRLQPKPLTGLSAGDEKQYAMVLGGVS